MKSASSRPWKQICPSSVPSSRNSAHPSPQASSISSLPDQVNSTESPSTIPRIAPVTQPKKSSAQITAHYTPETIVGAQVAAVVNFPPKQIGKFTSECLVLGFADEKGGVVLVRPNIGVPNGQRLH